MQLFKRFIEDLTTHALNLYKDKLHHKTFVLEDLLIEAYFSDKNYADLCEANLVHIKELPHSHDKITLYLLDSKSLNWPPPPRWFEPNYNRHIATNAFQKLHLWGSYLDHPRVWQCFDPKTNIGIQLIKEPEAMIPWESGGPLRHFLHWAYQGQGKLLCHAASLGMKNSGLLLIGPGGAGKSGTTLAGISHGLQTVGDDYCLIDPKGPSAFALFQIIKQDPEGLERITLPIDKTDKLQINWQNKYEIHRSQLTSNAFVSFLNINALVILKIAKVSRCHLKLSSAGEAMKAWALSSSFQLPDHEKESITCISRLCKSLPIFELTLSQDTADISETIRKMLKL